MEFKIEKKDMIKGHKRAIAKTRDMMTEIHSPSSPEQSSDHSNTTGNVDIKLIKILKKMYNRTITMANTRRSLRAGT